MKAVNRILKQEIKSLALDLKELKAKIKTKQRAQEYAGSEQNSLVSLKRTTRRTLLVYALSRGKDLLVADKNYEQVFKLEDLQSQLAKEIAYAEKLENEASSEQV